MTLSLKRRLRWTKMVRRLPERDWMDNRWVEMTLMPEGIRLHS